MLQNKELIIFDFDGVIINSIPAVSESYQLACSEFFGEGYPSVEEFLSHSGKSSLEIFQQFGFPNDFYKVYRKYSDKNQDKVLLFEKLTHIIRGLHKNKKIITMVTGKSREKTDQTLERFNLGQFFQQVVTSCDVTQGKPHPEGLLKVLEMQKIDKEQTIFIGDAIYDIAAAKSAGIESIAVTWGAYSKQELQKHSPTFIVETEEELNNILL